MLSAISWVPRGAAKPFPKTAELDEEEVAEVRRRAEGAAAAATAVAGGDADAEDGEERDAENDEDATMEEEEEEEEGSEEEGEADGEEAAAAAAALAAEIRKAKKGQSADDRLADELAELDMDHYDDEADAAPNLFGTGKGIGAAYYRSNDEDPYLTKAEGAEDEDDEDEIEDLTIRDTDLLILAARNEDDVSFIEVWVCEEQQRQEGEDGDDVAQNDKELNMYVHHDIMLPAFPLALAWMDFNPSAAAAAAAAGSSAAAIAVAGAGASVLAPGNFVAVATMDPAIEIWDLDVLDEVEPAASLGGFVTTASGAGGDGEEDDEEEWAEVEEEEEMEVGGGGSGSRKGSKGKKGKKDKGGKKGKKGREREPEKRGSSNKKGKSQGKSSAAAAVLKEGSHKGAVMALSWNREYRSVLASGGEDRRVKVWDMAAQRCDRTLKPHTGKVQAVAWAPLHATSLLSGSFDRSLALVRALLARYGTWRLRPWPGRSCTPPALSGPFDRSLALVCVLLTLVGQTDVRSPDATVLRWGVSADVEALAWDPHDSTRFVVSSEDGLICCHDTRAGSSNATAAPIASSALALSSFPNALFTIHAHTKAACTVSWNPRIPNLLASGSTDKTVKLWDLSGNQARCLESSNPKLGAVFSVAFCADAPGFLAMGGSKGKLKDAKAVSAWQWWQIATLYTMKRGSQTVSVSSQVVLIDQQLRTRALPIDSSAQYLVLTSADVALGDREKGFCGRSGYCGFHSFATDGVSYIKYGFVGNGEKCGTRCMRTGGSKRTPNGKRGVDGMISIVAHEMVETANNPRIEGGWYDALGAESSDKCMTDFGPSVAAGGNGYSYNMVGQGGMQWLVESNWRPTEPQGCAMTRTEGYNAVGLVHLQQGGAGWHAVAGGE
ncbi:unnamed protein product [Closterium sp. NIES-64]|nr:unnamed protein product [Closterium sp. NIES-64]